MLEEARELHLQLAEFTGGRSLVSEPFQGSQMNSPSNDSTENAQWESVHICPRCGHALNLAEIDLKTITTGIVECPKCHWEGPIEIKVSDLNGEL